MIEKLKREDYLSVLLFLKENRDSDFYYVDGELRKYITDRKSLKQLLKKSKNIYICKERGDVIGIVLVWNHKNGALNRNFVKITATNTKTVKDLITVFLWNYYKELYIKIKKESKFLQIIKERGFDFYRDRDKEILLYRHKTNPIINHDYDKDENPSVIK